MSWLWPSDKGLNNRWVAYHMADGSVKNSHDIYWRALIWEDVVKLSMCIRGFHYEMLPGPGHRGFITYRNQEWRFKKTGEESLTGKPEGFWYWRQSWLIGYLDSTHAHMTEVDFHTGKVIARPVEPIKVIESHVHPRLKQFWNRGWNPIIKERRAKHAMSVQGRL